MSAKYTLRVRCASWQALESFYRDRIRPGALLGARVPFVPQRGDQVTVALELPDGIVVAIDGVVRELGETKEGKTPIMLRLVGFDNATIDRLKEMVREGLEASVTEPGKRVPVAVPKPAARGRRSPVRPPPPTPEDAPIDIAIPPFEPPASGELANDQRKLYEQLTTELERLRELGAREVVGVGSDASPLEVRAAYFELVRQFHPDAVAMHHSPALTHAASELSIFINRAYDRVRSAVRAADGQSVAGPAFRPELGWLIDMGDIAMAQAPPEPSRPGFRVRLAPPPEAAKPEPVRQRSAPLTADSLFDDLASQVDESEPGRTALASRTLDDPGDRAENLSELVAEAASAAERGDLESAAKLFADALSCDPRDRKLRARYHAARGRQLLAAGDRVRATTQLEIALTHDPSSRDARSALDSLRGEGTRKRRFSGWFRR